MLFIGDILVPYVTKMLNFALLYYGMQAHPSFKNSAGKKLDANDPQGLMVQKPVWMAVKVTTAADLAGKIAKMFVKAFKWVANNMIPSKAKVLPIPHTRLAHAYATMPTLFVIWTGQGEMLPQHRMLSHCDLMEGTGCTHAVPISEK